MTTCISIITIYRGNYATLLEPYACLPFRVKRILTANEMFKKHQPDAIQNQCLSVTRLALFAIVVNVSSEAY